MNQTTVNIVQPTGVINDTATGFLLSTNVKSNAPQQFNIPTQVSTGNGRERITGDTTSPYLGVFNR